MITKWKLLSSTWALNEKWYKVRRDTVEVRPGKVLDDFFVGVFNDVVSVIAITEEGIVPLVRQYKHGAQEIVTELPAGYVEEGEDLLTAAKRELLEETGYTADSWELLGTFLRSPSKLHGDNIHIFLAKEAKKTSAQRLDENENIEVLEKPFSEVLEMTSRGEIQAVDSVIGILTAEKRIKGKTVSYDKNSI